MSCVLKAQAIETLKEDSYQACPLYRQNPEGASVTSQSLMPNKAQQLLSAKTDQVGSTLYWYFRELSANCTSFLCLGMSLYDEQPAQLHMVALLPT